MAYGVDARATALAAEYVQKHLAEFYQLQRSVGHNRTNFLQCLLEDVENGESIPLADSGSQQAPYYEDSVAWLKLMARLCQALQEIADAKENLGLEESGQSQYVLGHVLHSLTHPDRMKEYALEPKNNERRKPTTSNDELEEPSVGSTLIENPFDEIIWGSEHDRQPGHITTTNRSCVSVHPVGVGLTGDLLVDRADRRLHLCRDGYLLDGQPETSDFGDPMNLTPESELKHNRAQEGRNSDFPGDFWKAFFKKPSTTYSSALASACEGIERHMASVDGQSEPFLQQNSTQQSCLSRKENNREGRTQVQPWQVQASTERQNPERSSIGQYEVMKCVHGRSRCPICNQTLTLQEVRRDKPEVNDSKELQAAIEQAFLTGQGSSSSIKTQQVASHTDRPASDVRSLHMQSPARRIPQTTASNPVVQSDVARARHRSSSPSFNRSSAQSFAVNDSKRLRQENASLTQQEESTSLTQPSENASLSQPSRAHSMVSQRVLSQMNHGPLKKPVRAPSPMNHSSLTKSMRAPSPKHQGPSTHSSRTPSPMNHDPLTQSSRASSPKHHGPSTHSSRAPSPMNHDPLTQSSRASSPSQNRQCTQPMKMDNESSKQSARSGFRGHAFRSRSPMSPSPVRSMLLHNVAAPVQKTSRQGSPAASRGRPSFAVMDVSKIRAPSGSPNIRTDSSMSHPVQPAQPVQSPSMMRTEYFVKDKHDPASLSNISYASCEDLRSRPAQPGQPVQPAQLIQAQLIQAQPIQVQPAQPIQAIHHTTQPIQRAQPIQPVTPPIQAQTTPANQIPIEQLHLCPIELPQPLSMGFAKWRSRSNSPDCAVQQMPIEQLHLSPLPQPLSMGFAKWRSRSNSPAFAVQQSRVQQPGAQMHFFPVATPSPHMLQWLGQPIGEASNAEAQAASVAAASCARPAAGIRSQISPSDIGGRGASSSSPAPIVSGRGDADWLKGSEKESTTVVEMNIENVDFYKLDLKAKMDLELGICRTLAKNMGVAEKGVRVDLQPGGKKVIAKIKTFEGYERTIDKDTLAQHLSHTANLVDGFRQASVGNLKVSELQIYEEESQKPEGSNIPLPPPDVPPPQQGSCISNFDGSAIKQSQTCQKSPGAYDPRWAEAAAFARRSRDQLLQNTRPASKFHLCGGQKHLCRARSSSESPSRVRSSESGAWASSKSKNDFYRLMELPQPEQIPETNWRYLN